LEVKHLCGCVREVPIGERSLADSLAQPVVQPWPETLRKVGEKASDSVDPVWELRRGNVRVAEQDHLQQLLSNDSRLLRHSHQLDAGDIERVRPAVREL